MVKVQRLFAKTNLKIPIYQALWERRNLFSKGFFYFTDIRKLQEKAETSYTLITEEVEVLIWVTA